jgi:hypothetical protein
LLLVTFLVCCTDMNGSYSLSEFDDNDEDADEDEEEEEEEEEQGDKEENDDGDVDELVNKLEKVDIEK